jgi:hypothetical protein
MPPEIIALTDKPWLLAIILAIGAACGMGVERFVESQKRAERRTYWKGRNGPKRKGGGDAFKRDFASVPLKGTPERAKLDAAEQLRQVMEADFSSRALLNRPEAAVFKALDAAVIARNHGWQVMAQVSLGEFLASPDSDAYFAVNSKRVDFALMDEKCCVRHALEYQGSGHHQGSAAARDAVKKEALRKAGIGYHEVVAGHTTPAELKRLVEKLVPGVR